MTAPVFLATLGQRPEAITMALDVLLPRYHYDHISIVHTDPVASGIAAALRTLLPLLAQDYPACGVSAHEVRAGDQRPLLDITDQGSAEAYFYGLAEIIRYYRQQFAPVHLLVSGGRKAMSIYATVAATYLFGEHDHVWTVLTEPPLMEAGRFHLPAGAREAVQVVRLPLLPAGLPAGMLADLEQVFHRRSPRQRFLTALTPQENALAEVFRQHPYASNEALGAILGKAERTIENQFRSMYAKLIDYFDIPIADHHKRQVLLDILMGRV